LLLRWQRQEKKKKKKKRQYRLIRRKRTNPKCCSGLVANGLLVVLVLVVPPWMSGLNQSLRDTRKEEREREREREKVVAELLFCRYIPVDNRLANQFRKRKTSLHTLKTTAFYDLKSRWRRKKKTKQPTTTKVVG
jgi:hypothetical protein